MQILMGRDTGWNPQRRDDGSIPLASVIKRHGWHVVMGLIAGVTAYLISPSLFGWMSPTIFGLVLSVPLSSVSSSLATGLALKRMNLLLTPEEVLVPPVILRANALMKDYQQSNFDTADGLEAIWIDKALQQAHIDMLPVVPRRHRGDIDSDRAIAEAKLADAEILSDAINWLRPKERSLVLSDRALIHLVTALPQSRHESSSS